ncbi:MAG: NAD(P)-binding domain-containing protein, partial [Bacteroidota bacterium]
ESHSSVFETTHIISSKYLSQYEDFPWDDYDPSTPDYPSHNQLARYFQAYARHFGLLEHIHFNTKVIKAHRVSGEQWDITIKKANGQEVTEIFTDLVVCNGHHWNPRWPNYPGEFTGAYLHSHQFKKGEAFKEQRVLVIGGGNSACDVAVETSRHSKKTSISMRRGYRIIPKFFFGKPSDLVAEKTAKLPIKIRSLLTNLLIRVFIGKNKQYKLQAPDHNFGQTHPTINDELLYKIRHGKVYPKVDIERFEGKTVHFKDSSKEDFDVVIACTGFIITHPFFEKSFINYSEGPVPLYLKMLHPEYANLFFTGLFQPLGCVWPGAELQAKIIARQLSGKWKRPDNIKELVEKETYQPHYKQINTPRHTITVDYHLFRKELLKHLPKDWMQREPKAVLTT